VINGPDPVSVAFVLSGGASLGAIQVGILQALVDRGIAPDLLVGTSAGALNAAFVAGRGATVAGVSALAGVWGRLSEVSCRHSGGTDCAKVAAF
jgi:NTE family protein